MVVNENESKLIKVNEAIKKLSCLKNLSYDKKLSISERSDNSEKMMIVKEVIFCEIV